MPEATPETIQQAPPVPPKAPPKASDPIMPAVETNPEKKTKPPVSAMGFHLAEERVLHYVWTVPGEYDWEDMLDGKMYNHIAHRVKINSVISLLSDVSKFDCDVRVVEHTGKAIAVRPIRVMLYKETDSFSIPEDAFEIRHLPNKGFGARNKFNGTWLFQGKPNKEAASQLLKEMLAAGLAKP